jgi:hypothetical protein
VEAFLDDRRARPISSARFAPPSGPLTVATTANQLFRGSPPFLVALASQTGCQRNQNGPNEEAAGAPLLAMAHRRNRGILTNAGAILTAFVNKDRKSANLEEHVLTRNPIKRLEIRTNAVASSACGPLMPIRMSMCFKICEGIKLALLVAQ